MTQIATQPIQVIVSTPGPPGPRGASGPVGPPGQNAESLTGISITGGIGITGAFNILQGSNVTLTQIGLNSFQISTSAETNSGVQTINLLSGFLNITGFGNVFVTQSGTSLIVISGDTGHLSSYYPISNPLNFIKSGEVIGVYYPVTNPNNFARSGEYISGISFTGGNSIEGYINVLAGTNITLLQSGTNSIIISSTSTTSAEISGLISGLSGQLNVTGANLNNLIEIERNKNTVTGITVHNGASITGAIDIIGTGNVTVTRDGSTLRISGHTLNSGSTLPFVLGNVNITSGNQNSQFIQFTQNFAGTPIVLGNIFNNSGDNIVGFHTSGISVSGFYLNLTDSLTTNNYYFQYLATTGLGFYEIATSLLSQGVSSSSSSISTGSQALIGSGNPNFVLAAISGSTYIDWFNRTFYIKCTGTATDKEGWF